MEVEQCTRGDGEEIQNFLHLIRRAVNKGWPDNKNGFEAAQKNAERAAQGRQRRQKYMENSLRGLSPGYLQRKAQEYLMERPDATWNDFCSLKLHKDLILEVSSTFLTYEAQTQAELATIGQEMKNLRSNFERISRQCRSSNFTDFSPRSTGQTKNYPIL